MAHSPAVLETYAAIQGRTHRRRKAAGLSEQETLDIRRDSVADPKLGALLALVHEQAGHVGTVQDSTWQVALDAGWTDAELTETSGHVTLNLFTNYFNHLVQTDLDLPAAPAL